MPHKFSLSSPSEKEMFDEILNEYAYKKEKDVYVFSNGIMESFRRDGRYMFTVDGVGNLNKQNVLSTAMYLKVNCKEGKITYSFEKLFE